MFAFLGTLGVGSDDAVQRRWVPMEAASRQGQPDLESILMLESDARTERSPAQRQAEHLFEQASVQAEATGGNPLDLTWSEAKERMKEDFVLTTASEETLHQIALLVDGSEEPFERFKGSFDLANPEGIDWTKQVKLEKGQVLSQTQLEDLAFIASEYSTQLSAQSDVMVQEFEAALLTYWEQELGHRYRLSLSEEPPEAFLASTQGVYSEAYISTAGDWAVGVRFDSAEFPQFEDTITEAQRLKEEFYKTAMTVLD